MIYLGYNRDTDVVAHFWRDRLHEYLFGIKDGKHCPYIIIGGRKVCYDSMFEKWKDYVERKKLDGRITIGVRDEVLDKLAVFEGKFDDIILAKRDELEEWSKEMYSKEVGSMLANIFVAIYTDYTKDVAREVLKRLKIRTCPYCNRNYTFVVKSSCSSGGKRFTTRPEFDHFYNKSQHPLLALSFYNLVPSCPICNHGKATDDIGVNPYFDGFNSKFAICDNRKHTPLNINKIKLAKSDIDFSLEFVNPSRAEQENIKGLGLDVLYNEHRDYVMDLIEKSTCYGSMAQNQAIVDSFQGVFRSSQEVYDFVWGRYLDEDSFEYRPLSKLTRDILEQLGIV